MPSEDSKPLLRRAREGAEEEEEGKSLSSIVQARKKSPANAASSTTKSRPTNAVKKEEPRVDGEDPEFDKGSKSNGVKVKKEASGEAGNAKPSPASRSRPAAKVKKQESDGSDSDDKPIVSRRSVSNADKELGKKKRKKEAENKENVAAQQTGKRERKVYDFPGQKRDPPEERDPLRIFYESLYEQIPDSEMAQVWMMESGLLSMEEAKNVFDRKQKKGQRKVTSPAKAVTATKRTQSATAKSKTPTSPVYSSKRTSTATKVASNQSKKRKIETSEDDSDDDFLPDKTAKKRRAY